MPFRDAWIIVGLLLVSIGFGTGEPVVAGVGFVVVIIGAVARYWSRHLWDRLELRATGTSRRGEFRELEPRHFDWLAAMPATRRS